MNQATPSQVARKALQAKAYKAGQLQARQNKPLNDLHYFDLVNSIQPSIDLELQEFALQGFQAERAAIHKNQIELSL